MLDIFTGAKTKKEAVVEAVKSFWIEVIRIQRNAQVRKRVKNLMLEEGLLGVRWDYSNYGMEREGRVN